MDARGLSRDDAEALTDAGDLPAKRNPRLVAQWMRVLDGLCVDICEGRAKPFGLFASNFWIHLQGALTEIRGRLRRRIGVPAVGDEDDRRRHRALEDAHVAADELFGAFTHEERVFIDFRRQVAAHVVQESYSYNIEPGNEDQKQKPRLRRTKTVVDVSGKVAVNIEEAFLILDKVLAAHGGEIGTVIEFARRAREPVQRLAEATARAV